MPRGSGMRASGEGIKRVKGRRASEGKRIRVLPCLLKGSNTYKDIEGIRIGLVETKATDSLLRLYGQCGWFVTAYIVAV